MFSGTDEVVLCGTTAVDALFANIAAAQGDLLALPYEERTRLLETLETWFQAGGSAASTGERLYLHANSVRYRLRRIEELTGLSLTNPAAVRDLGAALEALPVLATRPL